MDDFEIQLNDLLVGVYRTVEKLEELMLRASKSIPLSISEIHLLDAVANAGQDKASTISEISDYLDIRLPSATAGVNKLAQKGYVEKVKCGNDGRVVRVSLTRQGKRAESAHKYFHRNMVRAVTKELSETERAALLKGLGKLDTFLDCNIKKYEG